MILEEGQELQEGKYVIEEVLGQGGFSIAYRALHVLLNHQVVIKIPFNKYIDIFNEEKKILAKLSEDPHLNIAKARDYFIERSTPCLVMDFIPGHNLYDFVIERKPLSETEAIEYIRQIGNVLSEVHQQGIVHRDVKPHNIIRRVNNRVVLIDFGIAKKIGNYSQSETSNSVDKTEIDNRNNQRNEYTENFAPYEQIEGKKDREPTVDVYSIAATLYYLVTGQPPTSSYAREVLMRRLIPPQEHTKKISNELNKAITKGLELKAENRPKSMQDWLQLLPTSSTQTERQRFFLSRSRITPTVEFSDDYKSLDKLLFEKKWREADQETKALILKLSNRETEGWLRLEDIKQIPCRDLRTIDQLWMQYSNERFGFSIQKRLWEKVCENIEANDRIWNRFREIVGWKRVFNISHFYFKKGYFPTIMQPEKGILIGKGAKAALSILQKDHSLQRRVTAEAVRDQKLIERGKYQNFQNQANTWQQRVELAMARGDEKLAQEALERKEDYIEKVNLIQPSLDKAIEEAKSARRKLRNLEKKYDYVTLGSLDWEIHSLSSRLEECDII